MSRYPIAPKPIWREFLSFFFLILIGILRWGSACSQKVTLLIDTPRPWGSETFVRVDADTRCCTSENDRDAYATARVYAEMLGKVTTLPISLTRLVGRKAEMLDMQRTPLNLAESFDKTTLYMMYLRGKVLHNATQRKLLT